MKAIILAGGSGTRMRPLTFSIPKPLLPFGEKPIIEHTIMGLRAHGVREILISVGYMAELIRAYCRDGQRWDIKIGYLVEQEALGTAGPIGLARELIELDEDFVLMNGDVITDLNFTSLIDFHKNHKFPLTAAYAEIVTKSPYGVIEIEDGRLKGVREKPDTKQNVNAGIYAISGKCIDLIPKNRFFTMVDLIFLLMSRGDDIGAFRIDGFWRGLENRDNIDEALLHLNSNKETIIGG